MAIRWKVVNDKRESCVVDSIMYSLTYKKGKRVVARPETIGILVFKTKRQAQDFLDNEIVVFNSKERKIIKVEGIGRGKTPKSMCNFRNVDRVYEVYLRGDYILFNSLLSVHNDLPKGTIAYKAVKVLT